MLVLVLVLVFGALAHGSRPRAPGTRLMGALLGLVFFFVVFWGGFRLQPT